MISLNPCKLKDAIHVKITDEDNCLLANVTLERIYKYQFDNDPEAMTLFIEIDKGGSLYDFSLKYISIYANR